MSDPTGLRPYRIDGMTQALALDRIARQHGGLLRVRDAARLLWDAGMVRGRRRHLYGHLYALVQASDRYEWVAPGVFRLLTPLPEMAELKPGDRVVPAAALDAQLQAAQDVIDYNDWEGEVTGKLDAAITALYRTAKALRAALGEEGGDGT